MCDNCKHPKEKVEAMDDTVVVLKTVRLLNENYLEKIIIDFITGRDTKEMQDFRFKNIKGFGIGKDKEPSYWSSILRHAILVNFLRKDIEHYGVLKITEDGDRFLTNPHSLKLPLNRDYTSTEEDEEDGFGKTAVLDDVLLKMLHDMRHKEAKKHNIPPYIIFQDPSLEDMATQYPITMEDMAKITGVSLGKAQRYAAPFIEMIQQYVEENEIVRPEEFIVKSVANKSKLKVNIIQGVDRKIPLTDIAKSNDLSMLELMEELDIIVNSGTKLNLDYFINSSIDKYSREEIFEYFLDAGSDSPEMAYAELKEDDITYEEILLVRIKFISEMAN